MEKYAVLGQNIGYSLSPLIHTASALYLNLNIEFTKLDYSQNELRQFLQEKSYLNYAGLSVTTPYKSIIAGHFASSKPAINTAKIKDGLLQTYSTDGLGFERSLARLDLPLSAIDHFIFLAGGPVVLSLVSHIRKRHKLAQISIFSRSQAFSDHYHSLAARLYPFELKPWTNLLKNKPTRRALIIQACLPILELELFADALRYFQGFVFELNYGRKSPFVEKAKELGLRQQDGLAMLIEQARAAQEIWWGQACPFDPIKKHLLESTGQSNASQDTNPRPCPKRGTPLFGNHPAS